VGFRAFVSENKKGIAIAKIKQSDPPQWLAMFLVRQTPYQIKVSRLKEKMARLNAAMFFASFASPNAPWLRIPSSGEKGYLVLLEKLVACDERQVFGFGLRHENAVEWITMHRRKRLHRPGMNGLNGQFDEIRRADGIEETVLDFEQALAGFDREFPNGGGAEKDGIFTVLNRFASGRRELARSMKRPEQRMRIEQELHFFFERDGDGVEPGSTAPSKKAFSTEGSGRQQRGCSLTRPAKPPNLRRRAAGWKGVRRTMGRPALARMISSPATASSTRRERWVLAAWMLTVFIGRKLSLVQSERQSKCHFSCFTISTARTISGQAIAPSIGRIPGCFRRLAWIRFTCGPALGLKNGGFVLRYRYD
jgi:hypothetical protein